jgi:uncharacterized protein
MSAIEFRMAALEPKGNRLEGYAVVYGQLGNIGTEKNPVWETIEPGAFDEWIAGGGEVKLRYMHDRAAPLASRKAGTLEVRGDARGVLISAELPDTSFGRDVATMLRRGDLDGSMSVGMRVRSDAWRQRKDRRVRSVLKAEMREASIVDEGVYADAKAALRAAGMADGAGSSWRAARLRELSLHTRLFNQEGLPPCR